MATTIIRRPEDFAALWNDARDFAELLAFTGGVPRATRNRAQALRRRGLHLKALPGSGERVYGVEPGQRTRETQPGSHERALLVALDDGPVPARRLPKVPNRGKVLKRLRGKGLVDREGGAGGLYHLTPGGVAELDRVERVEGVSQ